jgi:hypothetical protein
VILNRRKSGQSFAAADLAGNWYGHQIVSGDAPADDLRWGYGTVTMNNIGWYTATWNSPGNANEVTQGSIQINANGKITVNAQPLTHGVMNDAKDMIVFIDGTHQTNGNSLIILVKRAMGSPFDGDDLAGFWMGHHVVSGDDPPDDPRWGYGTVNIGSSGHYQADWTSENQTAEHTEATIQITSSGETTIDNQALTHGVLNDDKNMLVFIDGTNASGGNALSIFLRTLSPAKQSGVNLLLLRGSSIPP